MVLLSIFLFLIAGIILIFYIPGSNLSVIRPLGLVISGFVLFQSTILISLIDFNKFYYQQNSYLSFDFNFLNWNLNFGLDGFSAFFFLLSSLLNFLCVLYSWKNDLIKEYIINLLVLELLLLLVFSVLDILLFYIFFEAILIPMFLLIGLFGSRARKIRAAYLLFFYTFVGSVLMLLGILYIYTIVGSLSLEYVSAYAAVGYELFTSIKRRLRRCQKQNLKVSQNATKLCSLIEESIILIIPTGARQIFDFDELLSVELST